MKKLLILTIAILAAAGCKKDFGDLNVDTKRPSEVPPGTLFVYAQKSLVDQITTPNVNSGIFRLLSQQWTETTYIDESNYDLATRNIPQNFWNTLHTGVLVNLKESSRLIPNQPLASAATKANQEACIEILNVYTYSVLVNTYGNIPYSQALDINNTQPVYDDAATVYQDLLRRLDAALGKITVGESGFGSSDLLYGDDMAGWKTFGNSLKLRLGMIIADVNPALAKTTVESAAAGAIASNDENTAFQYLSAPPNNNPVWADLVQSGRKDFVAANTLVDAMKAVNDPRLSAYFTVDANGEYNGGIYGSNNNYATYSKPNDALTAPDYPSVLFDYAEVRFLLAEAAERGFNVGGTAAEHYEAAIRASLEQWGVSAGADAYLAQPSVAYATAAGDWKTKIGTQKWIALYNRGFDAWTEVRRLDAPALPLPADAVSGFPNRYTYPVQEQNLNTANYTAAASAMGGDVVEFKLFWDKF